MKLNNDLFSKSVLWTFIFWIILFLSVSSGCSILKPDKDRKAERKEATAEKKEQVQYNKVKKQHYKNQSNDARKMMKQTKKHAALVNKPKERRGFWKTKCK